MTRRGILDQWGEGEVSPSLRAANEREIRRLERGGVVKRPKAADGKGVPRFTGRHRRDGSEIWEWYPQVYDPATRQHTQRKMTGTSAEACYLKADAAGWIIWRPSSEFADFGAYLAQTQDADAAYRATLRLPPDFGPQWDRYLAHLAKLVAGGKLAPSTLGTVTWAGSYLLIAPEFGRNREVRTLIRADISALEAWLRTPGRAHRYGRDLSDNSIAQILVHLKTFLRWANAEGFPAPERDPFLGYTIIKPPPSPHLVRPEVLRAFARDCWPSRFGPLYTFLAVTGLRIGETLGLCWSDVQGTGPGASVLIHRQLRYETGTGLNFGPLKGRGRPRTVPTWPEGWAALVEERRRVEARKAADGWQGGPWKGGDLIFRTAFGRALAPTTVRDDWRKRTRAAGLEETTPHDCRHAFVTYLLEQDIALPVVSKLVGHSTTAITDQVYNHVATEAYPGLAALMARHREEQEQQDDGSNE